MISGGEEDLANLVLRLAISEMIAERALKRDTGARALRAVCEEIMLDMMYKLPDQAPGGKYIINESVVEGQTSLFEITPERRKQSA